MKDVSQEGLLRKKQAFEDCQPTTHWPNAAHVGELPMVRDGEQDELHRLVPKSGRPVLGDKGYKLKGIPYNTDASA